MDHVQADSESFKQQMGFDKSGRVASHRTVGFCQLNHYMDFDAWNADQNRKLINAGTTKQKPTGDGD